MAEAFGIPPPATKWPAEGIYVTLEIPRVEWCSQLSRGQPISTAASSKAAAGVRTSVETELQTTMVGADECIVLLGVR